MRWLALSLAALLGPTAAAAHDLWIERAGDGLVVRYGHRGGEALPLDAAKVKAIRCAAGPGPIRQVSGAARAAPTELRVTAPACDAVSVFLDGGAWSLTPDGEVNRPRGQAENVVRAWASRQYAKWVDVRRGGGRAVLGDELELVAVTDLGRAHQGDKITVRVLSAGRPVPDAVVAAGHRTLGETDSRGELRLRLRERGVESLSTSVRRPAATRDVDVDVIEATLTFEVGA